MSDHTGRMKNALALYTVKFFAIFGFRHDSLFLLELQIALQTMVVCNAIQEGERETKRGREGERARERESDSEIVRKSRVLLSHSDRRKSQNLYKIISFQIKICREYETVCERERAPLNGARPLYIYFSLSLLFLLQSLYDCDLSFKLETAIINFMIGIFKFGSTAFDPAFDPSGIVEGSNA